MPINSKQKGARAERELAKIFTEHGYPSHRTQQFCGKGGDSADVTGLAGIHVECKHDEHLNIYKAIEQAKNDHKKGRLPTVFHKKNNKKWLVTMELEDWFKLYQEFYSATIDDIDVYEMEHTAGEVDKKL